MNSKEMINIHKHSWDIEIIFIIFLILIIYVISNFVERKTILTLKIPPELFAMLLVNYGIIVINYGYSIKEVVKSSKRFLSLDLFKDSDKFIRNFFFGLMSTLSGLIFSILEISGAIMFILLICSITNIIWLFLTIVSFHLSYSITLLQSKSKRKK